MDEREQALKSWLSRQPGLETFSLEPASGDASFRRYFRVKVPGGSYIAMDAPPENESCGPYVRIADAFAELGLNVPRIYAQDLEQGWLLLSDLGTRHYLEALNQSTVERLYGDALGALAVIQACGPREGLPPYDRQLLLREMGLFSEWLLLRQLSLTLSAEQAQMLDRVFALLADSALEQPRVCVHRDYHSRNLLVTGSPNPGILDFQDALLGPVTYDLVSLLRDCYLAWPRERVMEWVLGYLELAVQSGVLEPVPEGVFVRWFDLMGVQRHLKASGIFARLNLRDHKPGYLADIPRTLGYIVELGPDYPELADLEELIRERVLPSLAQRQ
jgi:aminoglycoside/choline kinase family phosphotransferase